MSWSGGGGGDKSYFGCLVADAANRPHLVRFVQPMESI